VFLPLLLVTALPAPRAHSRAALAAHAGFLALVVVLVATNQLHKWAHARTASPLVVRLQRARLILEPARHDAHHRTQDLAYCVATGWMNGPLDRLGFFPGAERALRLLGLPMSRSAPRWRPVGDRPSALRSLRGQGVEETAC